MKNGRNTVGTTALHKNFRESPDRVDRRILFVLAILVGVMLLVVYVYLFMAARLHLDIERNEALRDVEESLRIINVVLAEDGAPKNVDETLQKIIEAFDTSSLSTYGGKYRHGGALLLTEHRDGSFFNLDQGDQNELSSDYIPESLRLARDGQRGVVEEVDEHGRATISAYASWTIEDRYFIIRTKVEKEYIWAPYIHAALYAPLIGFLVIAGGMWLFYRYGSQLTRELLAQLGINQAIFRTAKGGIIVADENEKVVLINDMARGMFALGPQQVHGLRVTDILPDVSQVQSMLKGERSEINGIRKDGGTFIASVGIDTVYLKKMKLSVYIVSDTSANKRYQKDIREKNKALEDVPVGVVITDMTGTIEYANPRAKMLKDMHQDGVMVGKNHFDFVAKISLNEKGLLPAEEHWPLDYDAAFTNQESVVIHERCSVIRDEQGNTINYIFTQENVTAEREAYRQAIERDAFLENSLKREEINVKLLLNAVGEGVVAIDAHGTVTMMNVSAERLFGYRADEVIGRNVSMLMPSPYREKHDGYLARYLETGVAHIVGTAGREVEALRKDGTLFPMRLSVGHANWVGEDIFVASVFDLTDRNKYEHDLIEARDAAERALQMEASFLANMSHEIRTPMNAIIGMTDIVLESGVDSFQKKYLQTVSRSSHSLLNLLNDILDVSKLESGEISLEEKTFSVKKLLADVVEIFTVQARNNKIHLKKEILSDFPRMLVGDPYRLRQVLINIVGNAVKFTEVGSVVLRAVYNEESGLQCIVRDTGIGIPADRLDAIFERFTQADESTTRQYGGSGLGMFISQQLVERMGGRITVESTEGEGSVFTITVPMKFSETTDITNDGKRDIPVFTEPLSILLVEDQIANSELVRYRMGKSGHDVVVVRNGQECMDILETDQSFDVILMDVQMPVMNGLDATRKIRSLNDYGENIPVIAMTASVFDIERKRCFDAGMNNVVGKPVDFPSLEKILTTLFPDKCTTAADHQEMVVVPNLIEGCVEEGDNHQRLNPNDFPDIDLEDVLKRWEDVDIFLGGFALFYDEYKDTAKEMKQALEAHDLNQVMQIAHRMRGCAGNFSAMTLADRSAAMENAARQKNAQLCEKIFPSFEQAVLSLAEASRKLNK